MNARSAAVGPLRGIGTALVTGALLLAGACGGEAQGEGEQQAPPATPTPSGSSTPTSEQTPAPSPTGLDVPSDLESLVEDYNAGGGRARAMRGADVSWPQCPKGMGIPQKRGQGQPMPEKAAEFVIVGLTNSPSFTRNPCLEDQLDWIAERGLLAGAYAVHTYPDADTLEDLGGKGPFGDGRLAALKNVGYQAALFNVKTMKDAGLDAPIVWLDIEPVGDFEWSDDTEANAAVVRGAVRGYRDSGLRVGFYSLESMWTDIVGSLEFGAPEWRPAGETSRAEAESRCADDWSFQGGEAVFGQWVERSRDHNVTCPGTKLAPARWFHRP